MSSTTVRPLPWECVMSTPDPHPSGMGTHVSGLPPHGGSVPPIDPVDVLYSRRSRPAPLLGIRGRGYSGLRITQRDCIRPNQCSGLQVETSHVRQGDPFCGHRGLVRKHVTSAKVELPTSLQGVVRVLNNYCRLLDVLFGPDCLHLTHIISIRYGFGNSRGGAGIALHRGADPVSHVVSPS
jgi:hypothetical protein